jgi:hypothetical protein
MSDTKPGSQRKQTDWSLAYAASMYDPLGSGLNPFAPYRNQILRHLNNSKVDISTISPITGAGDFAAAIDSLSRGVGPLSRQKVGSMASSWLSSVEKQEEKDKLKGLEDEANRLYEEWQNSGEYEKLVAGIEALPPSLGADTMNRLKGQIVSRARQDETARQRRIAATLGLRGAGAAGGMGAMLAEMAAAHADSEISGLVTELEIQAADLARQDEIDRITMLQKALGQKQATEGSYLSMLSQLAAGQTVDVGSPFRDWAAFGASLDAQRQTSDLNRKRLWGGLGGAALGGTADVWSGYASNPDQR